MFGSIGLIYEICSQNGYLKNVSIVTSASIVPSARGMFFGYEDQIYVQWVGK